MCPINFSQEISILCSPMAFGEFRISEEDKLEQSLNLIAGYEEKLFEKLLKFLDSVGGIRIIGNKTADATKRVPTI